MRTASLTFGACTLAWREFCEKLAPHCGHHDCAHHHGIWRRLRGKSRAILLQGSRYCVDECLERALTDLLRRARSASKPAFAPHRIPLGLLLLSRQQLTAEQLHTALTAQRAAGHGRIGEWLQSLGFASEQQVTAALARQWSCPVLRASSLTSHSLTANSSTPNSVTTNSAKARSPASKASRVPQIPVSLLESCVMIPVGYVEATATLHMAFGEGIDYSVLYAIEQMVGCRTEPCMAVPSFVRRNLQTLSRRRRESEVVFDCVTDTAEFARIVRSYCIRIAASEINLAACGPHLWLRLFRSSCPPLDMLLRSPRDSGGLPSLTPASGAVPAV
jgi:hypothetical protein